MSNPYLLGPRYAHLNFNNLIHTLPVQSENFAVQKIILWYVINDAMGRIILVLEENDL